MAAEWQSAAEVEATVVRSLQQAAEDEVGWFFGKAEGQVSTEREAAPNLRLAALTIRRWLQELPTFFVGALELRYAPRRWPPALEEAFGGWTSLIVRLECATHPGDGRQSTDALEQAAAARLEDALAHGERRAEIRRLHHHAHHSSRAKQDQRRAHARVSP